MKPTARQISISKSLTASIEIFFRDESRSGPLIKGILCSRAGTKWSNQHRLFFFRVVHQSGTMGVHFGITVRFHLGSTMSFHFWYHCALPFGNIIGFHFGTTVRFHSGSTMSFCFGTTVHFHFGSTMGFYFWYHCALPFREHYELPFRYRCVASI